ncbi:hypothetical protein PR048_014936 [Dryococelus australis]|uniref:Uncharacterized protein n=1 Tax=Dryococelus australis TaxID=614101 RepID=A0ABQ9HFJ4_9NEOP|nr:hypothetical protein PR048_014936 [Dryococelus australis]
MLPMLQRYMCNAGRPRSMRIVRLEEVIRQHIDDVFSTSTCSVCTPNWRLPFDRSRGATVAKRLKHSPPTKANRAQSPAGLSQGKTVPFRIIMSMLCLLASLIAILTKRVLICRGMMIRMWIPVPHPRIKSQAQFFCCDSHHNLSDNYDAVHSPVIFFQCFWTYCCGRIECSRAEEDSLGCESKETRAICSVWFGNINLEGWNAKGGQWGHKVSARRHQATATPAGQRW